MRKNQGLYRRTGRAAAVVAAGASLLLPSAVGHAAAEVVAPSINSVAPQSGPTRGGEPVRIYGSGFIGATSVTFGAQNATSFAVIDDSLITATVPRAAGGAADNNTFVDVTVTGPGGPNTFTQGFFYTNASLSVAPKSGLHPGDPFTATLTGYAPATGVIVLEANPLLAYVEGGPPFPPGPPPYVTPRGFGGTDPNGNMIFQSVLADPVGNPAFDPNIACPANQITVDYLGNSHPAHPNQPSYSGTCTIIVSQLGAGAIETPIHFGNDPVPAAPTLTAASVSNPSNRHDHSITLSGTFWNANPFYGSSTTAALPGQTKTDVQLCLALANLNTCFASGTATVTPVRYIDQTFSGDTLSGTIPVLFRIPRIAQACGCLVARVRQFRPGAGFIQATAPVTVG